MNNRSQTNSRGVNPRGYTKQVIIEKPTITRKVDGEDVILPNPRFGTKRVIAHLPTPSTGVFKPKK